MAANPKKGRAETALNAGKWRPGREALMLLYFPVYLLLFYVVEHAVTQGYWVSWCPLDDWIPFVRQFVYFYVLWYPLMVGITLWLLVRDTRAFVRYGWTVIIGLTASIAIFFLFPSGQELRPAQVPGNDLAAMLVRAIYAADTNTNVFPSMHVVGTLAAVRAAWDTQSISRRARWGIALLGVLINLSTVFIKQHSALDILGGAVLCAVVDLLVYLPSWRRGRRERKGTAPER